MFGLIISVILYNVAAVIIVRRLTKLRVVHMWLFTTFLHFIFDFILSYKYEGYWYFTTEVEWLDLPAIMFLSPPAALMFLDRYPFEASFLRRLKHILSWSFLIVAYEALTLLPEPWGYFYYGWWNLGYSALIYPLLFVIVLFYYKWICRMEKKAINS